MIHRDPLDFEVGWSLAHLLPRIAEPWVLAQTLPSHPEHNSMHTWHSKRSISSHLESKCTFAYRNKPQVCFCLQKDTTKVLCSKKWESSRLITLKYIRYRRGLDKSLVGKTLLLFLLACKNSLANKFDNLLAGAITKNSFNFGLTEIRAREFCSKFALLLRLKILLFKCDEKQYLPFYSPNERDYSSPVFWKKNSQNIWANCEIMTEKYFTVRLRKILMEYEIQHN